MSKINVLIVDDSRIYRTFIEKALVQDEEINIVGSVFNGQKAIEFIKNSNSNNFPDILTLDIEMPIMNGIETLEAVMKFNKEHPEKKDIGIIMVSSLTRGGADITIDCLEKGAFDFILKPASTNASENIKSLNEQLLSKIKLFAFRNSRSSKKSSHTLSHSAVKEEVKPKPKVRSKEFSGNVEAIIVGSSTGGPKALSTFLPDLSSRTNLPILLVQHMPPLYTASLAENLNKKCEHTVVEAKEGDIVKTGYIYIAPGGKHLVVKKDLSGNIITSISDAPPENFCKPSVDVLFRSAASTFGGKCIAVILTGMGSDGTAGLRPLKRKGVPVVVQDEKTCVVWGMPGSAFRSGLTDFVLPLTEIASKVQELTKK